MSKNHHCLTSRSSANNAARAVSNREELEVSVDINTCVQLVVNSPTIAIKSLHGSTLFESLLFAA